MNNTHIDLFDKSVTVVLATLYKEFPIPTQLSFNELAFDLWEDEDDDQKHFKRHSVIANTIKWLERSGYLWAEKIDEYDAYEVVLSPSGLELLKMPSSLKESDKSLTKSVGESLLETMKSGTKDAAKDLIKKALTEGFKLFIINNNLTS
jgi:hypothetical protein